MPLEFGNYDAEDDENLLDNFIEYAALPKLLRDDTLIVLGGKGAGKTALARRLEGMLKYVVPLRADDMNLASVHECVQQLIDQHKIDQRAVITSWQQLFAVQIMDAICASPKDFLKDGAQQADIDSIQTYLRPLLKSEFGNAAKNIGFCLTQIFEQLEFILERYNAKHNARAPESLLSSFPRILRKSAAALDALGRVLADANTEVLVVIDGFDRFLDRNFNKQYDLESHIFLRDLMISLLFAARDTALRSPLKDYVRFKILFPKDKLPRDHRDFVKIAEFIGEIRWTHEELYRFLCVRIARELNIAFSLYNKFDTAAMWSRIFKGTIAPERGGVRQSEQKVFEYLLRHTQGRPRDLLVLCRSIVTSTIEAQVFSARDIEKGVEAGTLELFTYFGNEFGFEHPYIIDLVEVFRNSPSVFRYDEKASRFFRAGIVHIKSRWPEPPWGLVINERYVVDTLCEVGFLGRVREGTETREPCRKFRGKRYRTEFAYELERPLRLKADEILCIHPMFYQALEITEVPEYIVGPISTCG